jgi:hypothetical protein
MIGGVILPISYAPRSISMIFVSPLTWTVDFDTKINQDSNSVLKILKITRDLRGVFFRDRNWIESYIQIGFEIIE